MKKIRIFLIVSLSMCTISIDKDLPAGQTSIMSNKSNRCPIFLVHGMSGWGPDEMLGYSYWGGFYDLKRTLEKEGYSVYITDVGALSSNWDRAIELYYQIKGGQVDYGSEHCEKFGHIQKPEGKYYGRPLYPQWDSNHPIHLIGHSMGGQTIRMLAAMLSGKDQKFKNLLQDENNNPFNPGDGWIKSITTLSTPHNGGTLCSIVDNPVTLVGLILGIAGTAIEQSPFSEFYNFDLEQWNLRMEKNESLADYLQRVMDTIGDTKDICMWDTSFEGAKELNETVNLSKMDHNTYCLSYATGKTFKDPLTGHHLPKMSMHPMLYLPSAMVGSFSMETEDFLIDSAWWENDGVVNTISMRGPTLGCNDELHFYCGDLQRGVWNYMGKMEWDHFDIMSQYAIPSHKTEKVKAFYLQLFQRLKQIE